MELAEPIERINKQLLNQFGIHTDKRPRFRVVWSEDQYEKRITSHTKDGLSLLNPMVLEVPKYKHYISERFILEQLSIVPGNQETDLVENLSYEPLWAFEDRHGNYLPPRYDACKIIIDQVYENMSNAGKGIKKYTNPDDLISESERIDRVEKILFGEETPVGDALRHGYGIVVPENKLALSDTPSSEISSDDGKTVH
jgi:hypothetical protein